MRGETPPPIVHVHTVHRGTGCRNCGIYKQDHTHTCSPWEGVRTGKSLPIRRPNQPDHYWFGVSAVHVTTNRNLTVNLTFVTPELLIVVPEATGIYYTFFKGQSVRCGGLEIYNYLMCC